MTHSSELDWQNHAACASYPTSWWFPPKGVVPRRALEICEGCPVRADCLAWALSMSVPHQLGEFGIYGGVGAAERRKLRLARCSHCRGMVPTAEKVAAFLTGTPIDRITCSGCRGPEVRCLSCAWSGAAADYGPHWRAAHPAPGLRRDLAVYREV